MLLQALQALVVARTESAPATLDFRVNISDAMGVQQNAQASMACPSTPASQAAGMRVTTTAYASCDEVRAELAARVEGQGSTWHDPHNAGTYTKKWASDDGFSTSRLTGDGSNYIDHQVFTLATDGDSCKIMACSRSQSSSYGDYSTNYCNLRMLYCGSAAGCKPVLYDFATGPEQTEPFEGATVEPDECLVL